MYSVAMQLASLPVQRVTAIVSQVAFPVFARIQDDPALAGQHLIKGVRLLSFLAFPMLWGISSIASEIVTVLLGAKWESAIVPLRLIALVMPLMIVVPVASLQAAYLRNRLPGNIVNAYVACASASMQICV